jgi:hypothetical protein
MLNHTTKEIYETLHYDTCNMLQRNLGPHLEPYKNKGKSKLRCAPSVGGIRKSGQDPRTQD